MDCSSITDFQQSTAISIAKKFRNLHIGKATKNPSFVHLGLKMSLLTKKSFCLVPKTGFLRYIVEV